MSNPVIGSFEETMAALDAMIFELETNLGKKHSKSPFDDVRAKFGGKPAPAKQEAKKDEPAQKAPAGGEN